MSVDVDQWRRAHPAWSVTLDGFEFRARPVSARAVASVAELFTKSSADQLGAMEQLLRLAFPWRFSYVWRGNPVAKIMALEPSAYREVVTDFFGHLGLKSATSPSTGGTNSPTPTPSPLRTELPGAA